MVGRYDFDLPFLMEMREETSICISHKLAILEANWLN